MTALPNTPSKGAAALAASLPLLFPLIACCSVPLVALGGDYDHADRFVQEMGTGLYVVLAAVIFAGAVSSVLVFLSGRGLRVPVALTLFVAAIPWLAGLAGASLAMGTAASAVAYADPATRAAIMAVGIAEASTAHVFGAWVASGLLSGVGLGLAIAAVGQRAPERRGLGGLLGALSALPLLGLGGWLAASLGPSGSSVLLPGLGVLVIAAVAAAAPGTDAPHQRSAALAAGAALTGGLAFVAAAAAVHTGATIQIFAALASASGASRGELIVAAAEELVPARLATTWGVPLALAPAVVVGGWALVRSGATAGRIAGGIAALLLAALFPTADVLVAGNASTMLANTAAAPWGDLEGFEAIPLPEATGANARAHAVVTVSGVAPIDGLALGSRGSPAVPWSDRAALVAFLRERIVPPDIDRSATRNPFDELRVAVDRRLPAAHLAVLVDAAREAGARTLVVLGSHPGDLSPAQRRQVGARAPLLASFPPTFTEVAVLLEPPPIPRPDRDPDLFHATVGAAATVRVEPRAGASAAQFDLSATPVRGFAREPSSDEEWPVYLGIGADATAGSLFGIAAAAAQRRLVPVLVAGGSFPGSPDQPLAPPEGLPGTGGDDPSSVGNLDPSAARPPGAEPRIQEGAANVLGSLPRPLIQRVVRRHLTEVRYCYQRELVRNPSLAGTVTVRFIVGPNGDVQSATVTESTLPAPAVAACVETAIRRWRFPAPEGGGVVAVTYPFRFEPSR